MANPARGTGKGGTAPGGSDVRGPETRGPGARGPRTRGIEAASPARACAYRVVRRVFEQGAYADRALHAEAASLPTNERSFAMALSYSVVQRRATLDHVIETLAGRPTGRLQPPVLAVLRLGAAQLLLLDGVAEHAAVDESVKLAKADAPRAAGLVNAVLRRTIRDGRELLAAMDDTTPERAALLRSVPVWLARLWFDELGADQARALLAAINEPAESALRVNSLVATVEQVAQRLPVGASPAPGFPDALILDGPFDAHGSELWAQGMIMPQSRGSMTPARVLAPAPGERVLDLCSAPGAKATQLAALMGGEGTVVCVERNPQRADGLRRTLARMRARSAIVRVADAAEPAPDGPFDRALVDPPCSGLGTLQSRPDLRWRTSPERIAETAALQERVLAAAAAAVRPGGVLVYSVCTISAAESEAIVDRFCASNEDFMVEPAYDSDRESRYLQLLPHSHRTDGFFVARLRRR
jgi:16S rRNA (cytosine967-C5)-methyltransferase